jgi:hypothetical protein
MRMFWQGGCIERARRRSLSIGESCLSIVVVDELIIAVSIKIFIYGHVVFGVSLGVRGHIILIVMEVGFKLRRVQYRIRSACA